MLVLYFIFILLLSLLFALTEIQIEGKFGWAKKLPTWRKQVHIGSLKFELTGYHLFMFSFVFLFMHFPYVFIPFNLKNELIILAAYLLLITFEDFFWFVFNPKYGLKNFDKEHVYWFKTWIFGVPVHYYITLPLAILLLALAFFF